MPKSNEPRTPVRHPETDSALLTPAERARAIIERQLASKQHGGPPGLNAGTAGGVHKPGKGGWSPAPDPPRRTGTEGLGAIDPPPLGEVDRRDSGETEGDRAPLSLPAAASSPKGEHLRLR